METSEVPQLGRFVRYVSENADGIVSPAVVIRTQAASVPLEEHKAGPYIPQARLEQLDIKDLESPMHVDLLVHGLGSDRRVYNVEFLDPADVVDMFRDPVTKRALAGTWHWPVGAPERL